MIGVGCMEITAKEREYVNRVLDSGLITSGPMLDRFEMQFTARHNRAFGLMVNSGTDALRIALAALKERHDWHCTDEVLVPALTFIATANIVIQNDLVPVFVDVDPHTFNIDVADLQRKIGPNTRAIIPVHLFGLPADMDDIMTIARANDLRVIEDSCEAMGVDVNGHPVGSWGDVACFSTYAAHIISTGVGGLAITDDALLAQRMKSLANHGRDAQFLGFHNSAILDPQAYQNQERHAEIIGRRFRFERIGYSSRATQFEAALGLAQLERLDEMLFDRANNFVFFQTQLENVPGIATQAWPKDRGHAAMMFPLVLTNPDADRRAVTLDLERSGIETRPFFNILAQQPYIDRVGPIEDEFPVAKRLSRNGFYVACHQMLTPSDLWQIVDTVKKVVAPGRQVAA